MLLPLQNSGERTWSGRPVVFTVGVSGMMMVVVMADDTDRAVTADSARRRQIGSVRERQDTGRHQR